MWGRFRKKQMSGEFLTVKFAMSARLISTKWGQGGKVTFVLKDKAS